LKNTKIKKYAEPCGSPAAARPVGLLPHAVALLTLLGASKVCAGCRRRLLPREGQAPRTTKLPKLQPIIKTQQILKKFQS